ncbi:MAG: hypothetical protein KIT89_09980 [Microcella sp.]|uniref:hypothetical protein n=1 Tax=Microcella sp. TaxID=1913979 RepID=UPI0024CA5D6A|nr:hypothetical protein [Microcella sp.]UYN83028.1 MAG: hypothetical protein KIT89_09980 [Microcella sp.]
MTSGTTVDAPAVARPVWLGPVLRAVPAILVGLAITFTADHSALLGLVMLSIFGLGSTLALLVTSVRLERSEPLRGLHHALALIAGVVGAASAVAAATLGSALPVLLLLIGGYAVLAGALELVWGIRHRDRSPFARDGMIIGVGTLALAVVLALVADPVSAVGFFGAYAVVLGVFLVIAGLSARWAAASSEESAS